MTAREAFARAWALRGVYLTIHLGATLLAAGLLAPLAAAATRLALGLSGAPAAADWRIAQLLLSPLGLVGALAAAALAAAVALFGTAAMIAADGAAKAGAARPAGAALHVAAARTPALAGIAGHAALRLLLRAAPFALAAALGARALIGAHDINYYLATRPPEFLAAVALGGLLGLGLAAVIGERLLAWALAPAAAVLGGAGPREALRTSEALMAGRRRRLLREGAVWALGALALAAAGTFAAGLAGRLLSPAPEAGIDRLAIHILLTLGAAAAASLAAGAAAAGSLASLIAGAYAEAGGPMARAPGPTEARGLPVAALLVAGAAAAAVTGGLSLAVALGGEDRAVVIAHRGAAGAAPENTLSAVERAIADGADWVEIDVQETADGAVIVTHDSDFMKLAGNPAKVWETTLAEAQTIDVGAWFGPDFAGETPPTLSAVLEAARGRARVMIELKHYGRARRLEERVAEAVAAAGMDGAVAAMSLDHGSAARMKALRPDWRVGLLAASAVGDLTRLPADFLAVSARLATPAFLRRAQAAGRDVYVWTVNDPAAMSRFVSLGAAGIITDEPARARAVLAERAEMSAPERLALLAADLFGVRPLGSRGRAAEP